ncbi:hypothetical protein Vdis_0957 [Vulcanisaeta distributa DSM 14429]|uniref:Uncharacterized protein n=1 Tax=Vulcanisaeta distributa (strain DSM 14429 / JCM 11212 / NBRC 100878 / IC-017) TaxID=572478 RepID=E1QPQ1_VULDI|nr:hypothetical protein Vdis_0957 [Vulcanisaeta distributa DSM 14429]
MLKVLLRFKDLNSLVKYLNEELNKLLIAKKILDDEAKRDSLVDIIEIGSNGNISMRRDRISEIMKGIMNELNSRIEHINQLLEEIKEEFNDSNFTGIVLLEFNNGIPNRVLLSQPLTLGDFS